MPTSQERERERDRDVEFGKLLESVQNLEKRIAQQRVEDLATTQALFKKIEELQQVMNHFQGAKGMALIMISTLVGGGAAVAEWIRSIRGH